MWLAERQIWCFLANRCRGARRNAAGQRPSKVGKRDEGHLANGQTRPANPAERLPGKTLTFNWRNHDYLPCPCFEENALGWIRDERAARAVVPCRGHHDAAKATSDDAKLHTVWLFGDPAPQAGHS